MYNTGNPVPSSALEDMADNAQTFDALVTKTDGTTTDRKGVNRRVFQQIIMDMGFQPLAGSFQTGAIITARNQALYDEVSQVFYAWGGALPKVVPVGSTPATAGGIGVGAWSDKTDLMLRSDLMNFMDTTYFVSSEAEFDVAWSTMDGGKIVLTADITLTAAKTTSKNINIDRNGFKFIWAGVSGTALKFYRDPYYTETPTMSVTRGQHTIPISSSNLAVGDIVVLEGPTVRWASVDLDYLFGQAVRITQKSGTTYTIDPAIIYDYQVTAISAYKPFVLDTAIDIESADSNTADTSFVSIGWCRDSDIRCAIRGNGPQNVGLGLSGDNVSVDVTVSGIKHNFTGLGYGVTVSGNKIKTFGKGSDCKHVYDAGTRTFVSTGIEFDMDVTKASDAPLYLYACGVHANTVSPKMRGMVSGAGHLLCDRTGSADIDVIFNELSSNTNYGCILINEMPPTSVKIRGKSSDGACSYILNNPTGSIGVSGMDVEVESHGKKILFQQTLNQSVKGLKIHDCKGEFLKFYSDNWTGCDIDIELYNNRLDTILPAASAYIQDHTAGGNLKIRSRNNIINDTNVTGYFRFTGTITSIDFESYADENVGTYRFIDCSSITTTAIKRFSIISPKTSATCNLSLPTTTSLYETSGKVIAGSFKHLKNPLSFSAWPCYIEANGFKLSSGINLATTIKPGPGNHDLNGNTLTWNSTNQAWPQY